MPTIKRKIKNIRKKRRVKKTRKYKTTGGTVNFDKQNDNLNDEFDLFKNKLSFNATRIKQLQEQIINLKPNLTQDEYTKKEKNLKDEINKLIETNQNILVTFLENCKKRLNETNNEINFIDNKQRIIDSKIELINKKISTTPPTDTQLMKDMELKLNLEKQSNKNKEDLQKANELVTKLKSIIQQNTNTPPSPTSTEQNLIGAFNTAQTDIKPTPAENKDRCPSANVTIPTCIESKTMKKEYILKLHPDKNPDCIDSSTEKFKQFYALNQCKNADNDD